MKPATLRTLALPALVALPALALYCATLMPDVGLWDTAEFQTVGPVLGIAHPTGYPAYTLLAWLASVVFAPLGNEAVRANLLSAALVAGAAGLVTATVTRLTRRWPIAIGAGAALALSVEAWRVALHADPHALHIFLAALLLLLLATWSERVNAGEPADRWLIGAAAVFGVALANHGLTLLLAPGIGLLLLVVQPSLLRRLRFVLECALVLAATTVAIYLYLPIRSAMNPPLDYANPQTWDGFRYLVFAEQFRGDFQYPPDAVTGFSFVAGTSLVQLGAIAVFAFLGVIAAWKRRTGLVVLLVAWLVVGWLFALVYLNADIGRYYLVPLLATAVLGALGADALWDWLRYRLTGQVLQAAALVGVIALLLPVAFPFAGRYAAVDESHDTIGRDWLAAMVAELPPNAVVVSWWGYSTTLWYGQYAEGLRPDVTVIDDSTRVQHNLGSAIQVIEDNLGVRPVFLIRLSGDMAQFEARYWLTTVPNIPSGDPVYRVDGRRDQGQAPNL
ncbi:MAG: DUF2723 domain-containing protein [Chloroflexota bacterium]|nr:DUF2723 domain-containing protein [Chloroflexota bacterium]